MELVNSWILNELAICQKEYFNHLEKKEINILGGIVVISLRIIRKKRLKR